MAGCYLPPDIFARYHRLRGNKVLMVSGSDMHGTPITVTAQQEGKTPEEVAMHYHKINIFEEQKIGKIQYRVSTLFCKIVNKNL